MSQSLWFQHLWEPLHLPSPSIIQASHSLTMDPCDLPIDPPFLTAWPKTHLINQVPHHPIYQAKKFKPPCGCPFKISQGKSILRPKLTPIHLPQKNPSKYPIKMPKKPTTEPPSTHPNYPPYYERNNNNSTCPTLTPSHTWIIPNQLWQPYGSHYTHHQGCTPVLDSVPNTVTHPVVCRGWEDIFTLSTHINSILILTVSNNYHRLDSEPSGHTNNM